MAIAALFNAALLVSLLGLLLGVFVVQATETTTPSTASTTSTVAVASTVQPVPAPAPAPSPPPIPPDDEDEPKVNHPDEDRPSLEGDPSEGLFACLSLLWQAPTTADLADLCRKQQERPHRQYRRNSNNGKDKDEEGDKDEDEEEQTFTTTTSTTTSVGNDEDDDGAEDLDGLDDFDTASGFDRSNDDEAWRSLADLADRHAAATPNDIFSPGAHSTTTAATTTTRDWLPGGPGLLDLPQDVRFGLPTDEMRDASCAATSVEPPAGGNSTLIHLPSNSTIGDVPQDHHVRDDTNRNEGDLSEDITAGGIDAAGEADDDDAAEAVDDAAKPATAEVAFWLHMLSTTTYGPVDAEAMEHIREDLWWILRINLVARLTLLEIFFAPPQHHPGSGGKGW